MPGVGPVAFIGTIYHDGKKGVINPFTQSISGAVSTGDVTATYTLNSDCTGTYTDPGGDNFDFPVSPDARITGGGRADRRTLRASTRSAGVGREGIGNSSRCGRRS